jgi:hypothetical protein
MGGFMHNEYVLVLNDREKLMAEDFFQRFASGEFHARRSTDKMNDIYNEISYEYRSTKEEQTVHGAIMGCHFKLRYRNRDRIFFSAWDCMDVCSVFYDMIAIIYTINMGDPIFSDTHDPFDLDLRPERYVFCTGESAVSFANMAEHLHSKKEKITSSSQYVLSIFEESNGSE